MQVDPLMVDIEYNSSHGYPKWDVYYNDSPVGYFESDGSFFWGVGCQIDYTKGEQMSRIEYCDECGRQFEIDSDGVATHRTEDGEIDFDLDLDHVPYRLPDDEHQPDD